MAGAPGWALALMASVSSAPADCNYEGRKVANGQVFTLDDEPCTQCICQVSWAWGPGPGAASNFCPFANLGPLSQCLPIL